MMVNDEDAACVSSRIDGSCYDWASPESAILFLLYKTSSSVSTRTLSRDETLISIGRCERPVPSSTPRIALFLRKSPRWCVALEVSVSLLVVESWLTLRATRETIRQNAPPVLGGRYFE